MGAKGRQPKTHQVWMTGGALELPEPKSRGVTGTEASSFLKSLCKTYAGDESSRRRRRRATGSEFEGVGCTMYPAHGSRVR